MLVIGRRNPFWIADRTSVWPLPIINRFLISHLSCCVLASWGLCVKILKNRSSPELKSTGMTPALHQAAAAIRSADALLITAGAGMGVDSGLPDFRGNEGFWQAYPVAARLGLSFAEMANPLWFRNDPEMAWAFYGHRLNLYRQAQVPAGHYGIASGALDGIRQLAEALAGGQ